jgi:hypothetical protein
MDIGRAFSYIFEDQEWLTKVAVAALVMLIPFIGWFAILGWQLEITRRVILNEARPLPAWSDFGGYLSRGFMGFVIAFVYLLPLVVFSGCFQAAIIPLSEQGNDVMTFAVAGLGLVFSCVTLIYGIAAGLVLPAALGRYADTSQIGDAFNFGAILGLVRAAPGAFAMVLIGGFLASLLASLGTIACFIGVFFTAALASAVNGHLYGQAYIITRNAGPTM